MNSHQFFSFSQMHEFLRRLHAFVGVFIGPFILIAALTGAIYGLSFSLENFFYKDVLYISPKGEMRPVSQQIEVATKLVGDSGELLAVRPAPQSRETTRVLFSSKKLKSSEYRTIFVNPYDLNVKADMVTYGSTGALPLRRTLDLLHRDLLLGEYGRWYSELAASWLWVTGVTGIILYFKRRRSEKSQNKFQKVLRFHRQLGIVCFLAILMLSVTGLTWSELAGENISKIRTGMHWQTPGLNRDLKIQKDSQADHSEHEINVEKNSEIKIAPQTFDKVLMVARNNGIQSQKIEIRPASKLNEAWTVTEIDRSYPTHVDAVAIDPNRLVVTDRAEFKKFSLMAKLTRWGIDIHMGSLFGLANQIVLIVMGLGISLLGLTGYWMWLKKKAWQRKVKHMTLYKDFLQQPLLNKVFLTFFVLLTGAMMPLFLVPLIGFAALEEFYYV